MPGKYVITLGRSSVETFLQFSSRRDLREKLFQAWIKRGENGGATDNRAIIAEMVALRAERAKLLGFRDLCRTTGSTTRWRRRRRGARQLLEEVWGRARTRREAERDALQAMIAEEGGNFALAAVGLALLRREDCARRATISMRPRSSRISSSTR